MSKEIKVFKDALYEMVSKKLIDSGVRNDEADIIADVLLYANLRGVHSHGVIRVEHYLNRIKHGGLNLNSDYSIKTIKPSIGLMDADGGFGHVAGKYAIEWAIKTCREQGIAVIGIKNSSHAGALGYYSSMVLGDKKIAIVMGNADPCIVPYGGKEAFFGTNALSYCIPGKRDYILADLATSEVSLGKILNARENNESIPLGWAIDENGDFTTDPNNFKYGVPFGGYKGYAIMTMVEAFTGILIGEAYGRETVPMYKELDKQRNLSTFMFVIDPALFNSLDSFLDKTQEFIDDIHSQKTVSGVKKVLVPGDRARETYKDFSENGIPINENIYNFIFS